MKNQYFEIIAFDNENKCYKNMINKWNILKIVSKEKVSIKNIDKKTIINNILLCKIRPHFEIM
jgi:hypothetical protein